MSERLRLWFLVGPTASGKSAVGVEVAERLGAEILSLDSMAVYRDIDIATAKPPPELRRRVPHHLLDLVGPHEAFSTGRYLEAAHQAVADIAARGKQPLFVGGTALYLKALTEGFFEGPEANWEIRTRLKAEARRLGTPALHQRLAQVDPQTAAAVHPNDLRRIVRALEVYEITGRPVSQVRTQFGSPSERYHCVVAGIRRDRRDLHERINRRVDEMFAAGLVEEVRSLLARPEGVSHAVRQFVGFEEVAAALRGELSVAAARERIKARTRQFAKRQLTWFRKFPQIRWVDAGPGASVAELAERVALALEG